MNVFYNCDMLRIIVAGLSLVIPVAALMVTPGVPAAQPAPAGLLSSEGG